jgi:hypothetical protein
VAEDHDANILKWLRRGRLRIYDSDRWTALQHFIAVGAVVIAAVPSVLDNLESLPRRGQRKGESIFRIYVFDRFRRLGRGFCSRVLGTLW